MDLLRLSFVEYIILKILTKKGVDAELYVYEIIKLSDGLVKRDTAYVTLGRMEKKGYVFSRKEDRQPGIKGQPRRFYRIRPSSIIHIEKLEAALLEFWGKL